MTLQPLNDCVLIDPEPDPDYAQQIGSSLIVPDMYKYGPTDPPKWGKIIAFGAECRLNKVCWGSDPTKDVLHVGDRVLYGKFGWAKVELGEGKHLALVRELDLIAVAT